MEVCRRLREEIAIRAPGWEVVHTGSGIFVAVCGFAMAGGGTAAVTVTGNSACLHRKPDGNCAGAAERLGSLGHLDEAEEEPVGWLGGSGSWAFAPEAEELLGEEVLREVAGVAEAVATVLLNSGVTGQNGGMKRGMIDGRYPGMIESCREVALVSTKITVSLPEPLLSVLDRLARQWNTTRSGTVAELLRRVEREELERELEEGYTVLAGANRSDAEFFSAAQAEVVLRDG